MSYLDLPRLCFSGKFQADVSTQNNDPGHYSPEVILNPWWNKMGSHFFQFADCTVGSVTFAGGHFETTEAGDSIVTTPVISTNDPQVAKMVDLDPEQQMVSQIWGLQLCIGDRDKGNYVLGNFRAAPFRDLGGRVPTKGGMGAVSATYLSVIDVLEWGTKLSPAMSALQTAGGNLLSIRFVVDLFDAQAMLPGFIPNPHFTWGRVCGAVGPAKATDPTNFVVGRFLRIPPAPPQPMMADAAAAKVGRAEAAAAPPAPPPSFNYAPAIVETSTDTTGRLSFDFGNSLSITPDGEPYPQMGTLQVAISGGATIGTIPATKDDYLQRSWIYDFFDNSLANAAAAAPLTLLSDGKTALIENENGTYVDFTEWVYRANPEDSPLNVTVMTLQWGKALANQTVNIIDNSANVLAPASVNVIPPDQPATNMPFDTSPGISFPPQVTTGSDGTKTFQVTLTDPGDPRDGLEGQVYAIAPQWDQDANPDPWIAASILLHTGQPPVPDDPQWETDILPIFAQYMKLYPFMQDRMNLADEATVIAGAKFIEKLLTLPMTDPRFMPVTRDLSSVRLNTILKWLRAQQK